MILKHLFDKNIVIYNDKKIVDLSRVIVMYNSGINRDMSLSKYKTIRDVLNWAKRYKEESYKYILRLWGAGGLLHKMLYVRL